MALLRRTASKPFLDCYRMSSPSVIVKQPLPNDFNSNFHRQYFGPPASADKSFFRRFLQRRAIYQSPASLPEFLSLPVGDELVKKLRQINITEDRLHLSGLKPPAASMADTTSLAGISVDDVRKILRLSQMEKLKSKLRDVGRSSVSYSDFVKLCRDGCGNEREGAEFAKMLDDSGNVIVFGKVVFLRPEQVARSVGSIICESTTLPNDPRVKELEVLEKQKSAIDERAKALVKGEMYCGLGFLLAQTLGFMRLTFWELSWDVMEPICFFVASLHCALGYGFFLRTSVEPSFEGFFRRRFKAKQKKLMDINGFDVVRYNHLRKVCGLPTRLNDGDPHL